MAYLRDKFIKYLITQGNNSPGAYCNSLDNIEKIFKVDIDSEYEKDKCDTLYKYIQQVRKKPEQIGKNEHDVRQYASNLNKYIKFRQVQEDNVYSWIPFYEELADKLLKYKNNRKQLLEIIKKCYDDMPIKYPFLEKGKVNYSDVDPFTVFGTFNRGLKDETRINILNHYKEAFDVKADVPTDFSGIPVVMLFNAWFFAYEENRGEHDIDNLWELFEAALNYADHNTDRDKFMALYDQVLTQRQVKWNITMGLYWIRPNAFINLDSVNREYLIYKFKDVFPPVSIVISEHVSEYDKIDKVVPAQEYFKINRMLNDVFTEHSYKGFSDKIDEINAIPQLSFDAWQLSQEKGFFHDSKENENTVELADSNDNVRYWLYSPGTNACKWQECIDKGVMYLGWGEIGDLRQYESKESIQQAMQDIYDGDSSYNNSALATWQFVHEIKPGDIVFVKKGMHKLIGRGVVKGDYIVALDAEDEYINARQVEWTDIGEWEHPNGQAAMKTLTDITKYPDYVKKLMNVFDNQEQIYVQPYTKQDFLNDVFMTSDEYDELVGLLEHKKNLILQGAPGVGKSYAAKRLAYSIIGSIDDEKVQMVQFHQSYSYEDFIAGFRPNDNGGFYIQDGPFYTFCKTAEDDLDNKYFFIIDEINRGNLSKIFGELMFLLESDKRGNENSINLLYKNEPFSVPENVYIIGMMNTADRSLAMIDYALRRRFVFYTMEPAFEKDSFKAFTENYSAKNLDKVINVIIALNADIASDVALGKGFRIGHSYFCSNDINDNKLSGIVKYEIIPQLYEYWFDDEAKAKDWESRLLGAIND